MSEDKQLSIGANALKDLLIEVIAEARKPVVDEADVARKKAEHDQLMAAAATRRLREQRKRDRCQHRRRSPLGVLAYKIAWQRNCDGKYRGVCQLCNEQFSPERTKPERYRELVRESLDPTVTAHAVQLQPMGSN